MLRDYLEKIFAGRDLTSEETERAVEIVAGGEVPQVQAGAFLAALRMKGESSAELIGAARLLRRRAEAVDCGGLETVDIVGTGGDGGISFNISTASAFVAAGAGVTIAKHGNRAVSGKCGSADVLAELGFNLQMTAGQVGRSVREHGIGFLFAQKMHPMLGAVAGLRRELRVRTIFNMLGPLCNPARASAMVLGVYEERLTGLFAETLKGLGVRRAMVVHGRDGLDEISCAAPTRVAELKDDGVVVSYDLLPETLLGHVFPVEDLRGGDAAENAATLLDVLENRNQGAPRAAVLLNAGAAIYVGGLAEDLREGVRRAADAVASGAARDKLRQLIGASRR